MVRVQRDEGYGAIPRSENVVRKRHLVLTGLAVTLCCALVAAAVITSSPSDPSFDEYQELAAAAPASGSGGLPTYADRQKALQKIAKITRQVAKLTLQKVCNIFQKDSDATSRRVTQVSSVRVTKYCPLSNTH